MPIGQDLGFALRSLRKSPAFTLAAVLSLALGIAGNTAIFSMINGLLLHPAGAVRPGELVAVRAQYQKINLPNISLSLPDFADIRDSRDAFSSAAVADVSAFNYDGAGAPERLAGASVTSQWFNTFGARPFLGRGFRPEDDQPGANQVAVLAYSSWQRLFGADRSIIGRAIELNKKAYRVVGVMPPDFRWPNVADLWVPLGLPATAYSAQNRFNESHFAVARIRPGLSFDQASSFMHVLTQRIIQHDPNGSYAKAAGWGMFIVPLTQFVTGPLRTPMYLLLAAVGCVLLIACSNIAGLMLVRATGRAREFAIRAALGATRWSLVRQMLVESLLLAAGGVVAGLAAAPLLVNGLLTLAPQRFATGIVIHTDRYVLLFTAGAGVLAALLSGAAPAWHATRLSGHDRLKEGGRADTAGQHRIRLRAVLVAGQVALALVLLVSAGLMARSLARMRDVATGFDPHGVITASVALAGVGDKEEDKQLAFFRAALDNLAHQPGVQIAAVINPLPFSGDDWSASFAIDGRVAGPGDPGPHGDVRYVSPAYFNALRIPIRKGRVFTDADRKGSELVAVIDENLAQQYWPNADPIGQRIRQGRKAPPVTIVGVVAHVKHTALVGDSTKGVYYFPFFQQPLNSVFLLARTSGDPRSLDAAIVRAVQSVDPAQAVYDVKTMDERILNALGPQVFAVTLLGAFAAIALLLAAIGLYAVVSYNAKQRTREIGIRSALGARSGQIMSLVVGQGMAVVAVGAVVGLCAAAAVAKLLSAQLFRVSPFDAFTFAATAALLCSVGLLATVIPAWRAAQVDPVDALRYE